MKLGETENEFRLFIQNYNKFIEQYFTDFAGVTNKFKKIELKRRETLKDNILTFKVHQVPFS